MTRVPGSSPRLRLVGLLAAGAVAAACGGGAPAAGPAKAVIQNNGSDTMVNVAQPGRRLTGRSRPTSTSRCRAAAPGSASPRSIKGTVDIANASRDIKPEEVEQAKQHGQGPEGVHGRL